MADLEFTMFLLRTESTPGHKYLESGRVPVAGAVAHAQRGVDTNANTEQMLELAYDVAEMSIATFTKAREQGLPLVALPIFFARIFPHRGVWVAPTSGIKQPSDLRGKRIGARQFWISALAWHRLVLHREHGITADEMSWVTCQPERLESLRLPPGTKRSTPAGTLPRELLSAGEVDAIMLPGGGGPEGSVCLYPDSAATERDYYQRTGIFPAHHLIVMKEELARREPWLVGSLCDAFQQAKELSRAEANGSPEEPIPGLGPEETKKLFGEDPFPYGITPNRKVIETFLQDVREQGLIDRALSVDELFAPALPDRYR